MTTVRDRLAAALREHRFEPCSISESGYLEWWGRCAACGFEGKRRHRRGPEWELNMRCDEVDHQLEVLRALPGIAIVELPEPDPQPDDGVEDAPSWRWGELEIVGWEDGVITGSYRFARPIGLVGIIRGNPDEIRILAAQLLSAANAAEVVNDA